MIDDLRRRVPVDDKLVFGSPTFDGFRERLNSITRVLETTSTLEVEAVREIAVEASPDRGLCVKVGNSCVAVLRGLSVDDGLSAKSPNSGAIIEVIGDRDMKYDVRLQQVELT